MLRSCTAALFAALPLFGQAFWHYIPPDAVSVASMQWRKVLESPLRDAVRRDIPGDIAPLFGGINFIEGIERATVTRSPQSTLIILTGTFDLDRLRELAVEDGGVSRPYQSAELLLDPEGESLTQMALVSGSIVLIGRQKDLEAAVDRAGGRNTFAPPGPALTTADLWVHSRTAGEDIDTADLAVTLGDQVRIDAWAVARTPEAAAAAAQAARLQRLEANIDGRIVKASGQIAPRDFQARSGQWLAVLQQPAPPPERRDQKIRIYGLEGGVREIPVR